MKHLFQTILTIFSLSINAFSSCNILNSQKYGDCSNVNVVYNTSKGMINVDTNKTESGIIDSAKILSGGNLYFTGICGGSILVNKNAKLTVTGIVSGTVVNNGGIVIIDGNVENVLANSGKTTINGIVSTINGNGKVILNKSAVVSNKPIK